MKGSLIFSNRGEMNHATEMLDRFQIPYHVFTCDKPNEFGEPGERRREWTVDLMLPQR